jgi:ADP-ribose pyrophosphatase
MKKWKTLKETDISPSKWFPLWQHTVELPNGNIIDDYFVSPMGNVAMVFPITKNNEVVLVKQYKHGIDEIVIELPAGFQQERKTLEESALAELEEETGIKTTLNNLVLIGKVASNPTKTKHITYCYLAKNLEFNSKQNLEVTEDIEIITTPPAQVLEMVKNGEIWVSDSAASIAKTFLQYPEIFK